MIPLEELEKKVKINPYGKEFYDLAVEYQKCGRLAESKKVLLKGLEKNISHINARLLLSQILVAEGDFDEAEKHLKRILFAFPDNVKANHLIAEIYYAKSEKELALKHYKVVELFEPDRAGIKERIEELEGKNIEKEKDLVNEGKKEEEVIKEDQVFESNKAGQEDEKFSESLSLEEEAKTEEVLGENQNSVLNEEILSQNIGVSNEQIETDIGNDTLEALLVEDGKENVNEQERVEEEPQLKEESLEKEVEVKSEAQIISTQSEGSVEEEEFEETHEEESTPKISTITLAELYEKQGYPEKAIEIYQHVLLKEPERDDIRKKIEYLKKKLMGMNIETDVEVTDVQSALRMKRIAVLKEWLRKIREA